MFFSKSAWAKGLGLAFLSLPAFRGLAFTSPATEQLSIHKFQTAGTHNSYRLKPHPKVMDLLHWVNAGLGQSLEYQHSPLKFQLEHQRVRQIELDIFYDPQGGHFSTRRGLFLVGLPYDSGEVELQTAGSKVLHFPDFDYNSTCLSLTACLKEVKSWSLANPQHFPLMILTEFKTTTNEDLQRFGFTIPHPMSREFLESVEDEILSVFERGHLITPDLVRGPSDTLEEAVRTRGWPSLAKSRGKILFAMDNGGTARQLYLEGHPSLRGRVMFVSSEPGNPEAAFIKMNDPTGSNTALIRERVKLGYLIRTRADADTKENRTGDTTRQKAALSSGAQYISTDFPDPVSSSESGYHFRLPANATVRCNPVFSEKNCVDF